MIRCLYPVMLFVPAVVAAGPPPVNVPVPEQLGPQASVHVDAATGIVRAIFGLDVPVEGDSPAARALDFVIRYGDMLGGIAAADVRVERVTRHKDEHIVAFQLLAGGLPVDGRFLRIQLSASGRVEVVSSDFVPVAKPKVTREISAERARQLALLHIGGVNTGLARRVVFAPLVGQSDIAYRVGVARVPLALHYWVYVRARDGVVLSARPAGADQPRVGTR